MLEAAQAAEKILNEGRTLFSARAEVEVPLLRELSLMTTKPFLYAACRWTRAGFHTLGLQSYLAAGKVRMEGKDYLMHVGDVVEFRSGLTSGGKR